MAVIPFDVELAIDDPKYPGLRIAGEFLALQIYLDKLGESVRFMQDQELVRAKAVLRKGAGQTHPSILREKVEHAEDTALNLLPRFFMGGFIIALSAAFESAMHDVADYVQHKTNARLSMNDLRESSTHKRVVLYLEAVLGPGYSFNAGLRGRLQELNTVRNCFAHANGRMGYCKPKMVQEVVAIAKSVPGARITDGALVVDEIFVRAYFDYVTEAIVSVVDMVDTKYGSGPSGNP